MKKIICTSIIILFIFAGIKMNAEAAIIFIIRLAFVVDPLRNIIAFK
ncbi:MAG: hypothetical protein K2J85_00960 [Anaeroplasmataceae bacterium]|nr:hypothetical protein [Anaeroplasmataceae bacterium]